MRKDPRGRAMVERGKRGGRLSWELEMACFLSVEEERRDGI